jgi:hypothetical protein
MNQAPACLLLLCDGIVSVCPPCAQKKGKKAVQTKPLERGRLTAPQKLETKAAKPREKTKQGWPGVSAVAAGRGGEGGEGGARESRLSAAVMPRLLEV